MSKSCWSAIVLVVISLRVILLSLEAEAQPTVDETTSCGSSTLEDVVNLVKLVAANQQETARNVKKLLASSPTECDAVEPSKQALVSALVCVYLVCF